MDVGISSRVVLRAPVMGPFDFGGVCSTGPCFVHDMQWVRIGVQIRGAY